MIYNVAVNFGVSGLMKVGARNEEEAIKTARLILQNMNWAQIKNHNEDFDFRLEDSKVLGCYEIQE